MTGVFILLWSDEHEKTEEKTKREIELAGLVGHHGCDAADIQKSAWGD
ncbi:hypothetical protein [Parageobacillus genomosp. 1]|nr:hypothetical protein [Parageobacillus genomosp. 1]